MTIDPIAEAKLEDQVARAQAASKRLATHGIDSEVRVVRKGGQVVLQFTVDVEWFIALSEQLADRLDEARE